MSSLPAPPCYSCCLWPWEMAHGFLVEFALNDFRSTDLSASSHQSSSSLRPNSVENLSKPNGFCNASIAHLRRCFSHPSPIKID